MFGNVNELAILVAAVVSVAVGSIWYSPLLLGKLWMRSAGLTVVDEDISAKEATVLTVKAVIAQTVFFYAVAQFILFGRTESISFLTLGVFLTMLLISYTVSIVVWEKRPLAYLLIHAGYGTVALFGGIGVIAFWPW